MLAMSGLALAQVGEERPLDRDLNEISGLEQLDDSTLVAINDGGNHPEITVMDLQGNIKRRVLITNGSNKDWEDITSDGEYLYIGDFGNNLNKRKNQVIYRVLIEDIFELDIVSSDKIAFSFKEQTKFPPSADSLFFDVEGMCHYNDSIWVFTKNRSNGEDQDTWVYVLPKTPGEYNTERAYRLNSGRSGWWSSGITAADANDKHFFLMTYDKIIAFEKVGDSFNEIARFEFETIGQRESLLQLSNGTFLIADEKNSIFGEAKLYSLNWNFTNE
jgi:hypothetical protein